MPKNVNPIIECVPNFSEGRNQDVIDSIATSIRNVKGVQLLHVDIGFDANRTVMTFAGKPDAVVEAAFQAIKKASELIDMSLQKGAHPRFGATDVCPLIPIANISMNQVVEYSKILAKRVGDELEIPVYLYENSASSEKRKDLAYLRKGEYESIVDKIESEEWVPDFGPQNFNAKTGNIAIGARNFLIAFNVNLKSNNLELARKIATEVRTKRFKNKEYSTNKNCAALKAIAWEMAEYNCVQVSTNIVDYNKTGLHDAFEAIKAVAKQFKIETDGSELIGLIPLSAIVSAGKFYSDNDITDEKNLIEVANRALGLSRIKKFDPKERVIEYLLSK